MSCDLAKAYEPKEVERRIYDFWMQGGYFHAEADPQKKPTPLSSPRPISQTSSTWAMPCA